MQACQRTFLDKFSPLDSPPDLGLVRKTGLASEGLVQSGLKILVSERILTAEIQQLCFIFVPSSAHPIRAGVSLIS
jgi:hypothetical protein